MKCPRCGLINPDTALRCDCGYDFAAKEIRESYVAAAENAKAGNETNRRFGRFVSGHTRAQFVVLAFAFMVLLSLAGIAFELLQIALLSQADASNYITTAGAEAVSILEALGALLEAVFFFLSAFAFLFWVYRANKNLQALGYHPQFTPGWAVGWWFVPVANFYYPYKVVKEIWQWSDPGTWLPGRAQSGFPIIGLWWTSYLAMSFALNAENRSLSSGAGVDDLLGARWVTLGTQLLTLISAILAIYIVARTDQHQEQMSQARVQTTLAAR
jgi:hypothetical protein